MLLLAGADSSVKNTAYVSARDEARFDSIDIYFCYKADGKEGLEEKYPQYSYLSSKKKRSMICFNSFVVLSFSHTHSLSLTHTLTLSLSL